MLKMTQFCFFSDVAISMSDISDYLKKITSKSSQILVNTSHIHSNIHPIFYYLKEMTLKK